jgi:hypothetical protein
LLYLTGTNRIRFLRAPFRAVILLFHRPDPATYSRFPSQELAATNVVIPNRRLLDGQKIEAPPVDNETSSHLEGIGKKENASVEYRPDFKAD